MAALFGQLRQDLCGKGGLQGCPAAAGQALEPLQKPRFGPRQRASRRQIAELHIDGLYVPQRRQQKRDRFVYQIVPDNRGQHQQCHRAGKLRVQLCKARAVIGRCCQIKRLAHRIGGPPDIALADVVELGFGNAVRQDERWHGRGCTAQACAHPHPQIGAQIGPTPDQGRAVLNIGGPQWLNVFGPRFVTGRYLSVFGAQRIFQHQKRSANSGRCRRAPQRI